MDDLSITDSDALTLGPSVAAILGIKGTLRFRPHGSTQKAHVILRRVTVSEDSSDDDDTSNVVRFSLFAQKRIEVKPGKEILLTVASHNGPFKDQPVVLEGDTLSAGDTSDEEDDTQVADEEDTYLPPAAMPPKMRKAWAKKPDDMSLVTPILERPAITHTSIGIQVEPSYVSASTQAQPSCTSASSQTHVISVSASVQVDPSPPRRTSTAVQTTDTRYTSSNVQTDEVIPKYSLKNERGALLPKDIVDEMRERSLSPMELDSPPDSPHLSTPLLDSPRESSRTPALSPINVPDLVAKLDHPPTRPSPTSSIASSSGAQDMQLSPIGLKSSSNLISVLASDIILPKPYLSSTQDVNIIRHVVSESIPISSGHAPTPPAPPSSVASPILSITDIKAASKPTLRPGKSEIRNPFVSAGFMTEFVAPVDKLSTQEKSVEPQNKAESTARKKLGVSPLPSTIASANTCPPIKPKPTQPPLIAQNAVASSSKVLLEKSIPTGPTHNLRLYSTRALEKSPAALGGLAAQSTTATKRLSPPPDPKALAYITSGPSSNPLNIRPSANATGKVIPTAPKTLTQTPIPAKKRVVVGAGWPFVKATNGNGSMATATPPTPAPSTSAPPPAPTLPTELSHIVSYSSPSPPPSAPPPLPASAPQPKWKRVTNDLPPTPAASDVVSASVPATPCPLLTDGKNKKKQAMGKAPKTPLSEKPQASEWHIPHLSSFSSASQLSTPMSVSLKDRIAPVSASAPTTPAASTPSLKANGRDLRSRISDASSLPKLRTTSPVIDRRDLLEATASATATRSPVVPPSTPSLPTSVTPTTPSLTHPLPPKPVLALAQSGSRGVKRERPKSPDHPPESARRKKRAFRWPTVDSNYSTKLLGEGQLGIRSVAFNSDGTHFALCCADRTIRIWSSRNRTEIARLSHNSLVVAVAWIDGDSGVVSLAEDGLVSKWTRSGVNHWQWAKVLDAGKNDRRSEDDQVCLAYMRDRIAVSFPRTGVKVWVWSKGTWQSQRSILRQNVTAIRFVEDGAALVGGTRDGVLWYCEIPNGTLRAYAFLKSKIHSLDLTPSGSHVLVGVGTSAALVGIRRPDSKGTIEQAFTCKEMESRPGGGFGAVFATEGQAVLFGSVEGCALVWDRKRGAIVYGLEHEEDDTIQAVASFDGPTNKEGYLVTGTKAGQLAWWSQPIAAPQADEPHKRAKLNP
ncbi:hypothetical protein D9615_001964 [Tricholomella constricta]|uniref:WD40 repeat-like protein n=1 Tax=Tricholomella constricta TaxID=117010 RepID=A0A8H5HPB0_9AGAR|nr:hypothetical protein D9615_001964 [Tricholomella constricta]